MENVFTFQELKDPNIFQKIFRLCPKDNSIIELNNLLASKPLRDVKVEDIEEISSRYKVNLHDGYIEQLKGLYRLYLKKCLEDSILSGEEIEDLNYLKNILILTDNDIKEIHDKLGGDIYKSTYEDAISNGTLEKSKEAFLDKLQKDLRLPDELANKISSESRKHFIDIQLGKITEDERVSPEEWEELNKIAKNLNVELKIEEGSIAKLEKMKQYWLIENKELPVKSVTINLQKSEYCHFSMTADWLETRNVTQRINYGGPAFRIKIMKGVYYRAGSVKLQRITSEQLQTIDSGTVYLTNKRIIFMGNKKNANIPLNKILSITPYSDGIGIEKDSGKSPILRVSDNADIFALMTGRLINNLH